jgi:ATP-binding cassette subfamily F protein 3
LEAVLWLEKYLKSYEKTILLVSHDRAFLNDVCTDIILFHNRRLDYYRGNYDSFEKTRKEMRIVQQKQHEAQQIKLQHMQDFVDKFRYNAKRASLVQSRIKAIEKETVIEEVEQEEEFKFDFYDAGQLGRPIVAVEGITFGYPPKDPSQPKPLPLFKNVHANIDQSSRIALVGPNGCGKSTLLKMIEGKLNPWEGIVKINPQLKISVFTQHHMDSFDLNISPLQNMMNQFPNAIEVNRFLLFFSFDVFVDSICLLFLAGTPSSFRKIPRLW